MSTPTLKLSQLKIQGRIRTDFGNLQSMTQSIKKYGLIHPIVVETLPDGNYKLLAGERRTRACVLAGLGEAIPFITKENLSEFERKEIELEENICRQDFTWQEEVDLKAQLHDLNQTEHGFALGQVSKEDAGWGMEDTATKLNESKASTSRDIKLARFLRENPEKRKEYKNLPKTTAFRKMQKSIEAKELRRTSKLMQKSSNLKQCTASEGMAELEPNSIDMILTDPPYGTDAVGVNKSKSVDMVASDNLDALQVATLLEQFINDAARVLKPGRHMYVFFALEYYNFLVDLLKKNNFALNRYPIIWSKGVPMTAGTGLNYTRSWEPILFAYKLAKEPKDIRMLDKHMMDIIPCKPVDKGAKFHTFEKPQELLETLVNQSSLKGELVLDPFAGSCSTLVAALNRERSALGFEPNEDHFNKAQSRLERK